MDNREANDDQKLEPTEPDPTTEGPVDYGRRADATVPRVDLGEWLTLPEMLLAAAIVLATFVAYWPAIQGGWIWDDDQYVTNNPVVQSDDGLIRSWIPRETPQYYPLVFSSFWLEYRLWGLNPLGFHLVNVALHAISAILFVLVLRRLGVPGAWLAGAVFALHPVHVESVAWITERKNVLSLLFYLLALLAFLGFERRRTAETYAASLALFVMALLSKTVVCTLPAAIALLWWYRGHRFEGWSLLSLAPFFVVGIAMGLVTAMLEVGHVGAEGDEWSLSFADRICLAGRALWFYPMKLTWPATLIFFYPRWEIDAKDIVQWAWPVMAVAIGIAAFALRGRIGRGPFTGLAFMAGTLLPALGFFDVYPFRYSFVADHFQYHASMGWIALVCGLVGWGMECLVAAPWPRRAMLGLVGVALSGALGTLTWKQAGIYENVETLWRDTIAKSPDSWMPYNNLGTLLREQGNTVEAIAMFETAIRLKPDCVEAHRNLGNILVLRGSPAQAIYHYETALASKPDSVLTLLALGTAMGKMNRRAEAEKYFRQAVEVDPDFALAHSALGNELLRQRRYREAQEEYRRAIKIRPTFAKDFYNLGVCLRVEGRLAEAEANYRKALELDPRYARAMSSLGALLAQQGRLADALAQFKRAVQADPKLTSAYVRWAELLVPLKQYADAREVYRRGLEQDPRNLRLNLRLAWLLATCPDESIRQPEHAVKLAEWVCQATGNRDAESLDVLAAAYASAGNFQKAVESATQAIQVAGQTNRTKLIGPATERLNLYKSQKPYHLGS